MMQKLSHIFYKHIMGMRQIDQDDKTIATLRHSKVGDELLNYGQQSGVSIWLESDHRRAYYRPLSKVIVAGTGTSYGIIAHELAHHHQKSPPLFEKISLHGRLLRYLVKEADACAAHALTFLETKHLSSRETQASFEILAALLPIARTLDFDDQSDKNKLFVARAIFEEYLKGGNNASLDHIEIYAETLCLGFPPSWLRDDLEKEGGGTFKQVIENSNLGVLPGLAGNYLLDTTGLSWDAPDFQETEQYAYDELDCIIEEKEERQASKQIVRTNFVATYASFMPRI